nr:MAG TPA: hypothetical protein [Caudoviricetes sp.]
MIIEHRNASLDKKRIDKPIITSKEAAVKEGNDE